MYRLSITKWIHLHKGDDGIRSFFYSIYASLRSGGRFVLEPQPWRSYTRKSKLTQVNNYLIAISFICYNNGYNCRKCDAPMNQSHFVQMNSKHF